ncbi:GntR family transcriptional regulator [Caulobacter sp. UNC279MFTsu5.1]|uniref:GntR family transcriptional regulator n=1 Tax=Caulobacter sp. UNC279MFTsu5.1 TaxID=1502775 RepID=UPI0008E1C8B8|nr:GntR family transcriptional regulator [Caulobacter sp. UNC279MFTsu5.1]SFI51826.1 regulatory protein, gntR family [Caulobacter sp. UNC279MFTsu5.1]
MGRDRDAFERTLRTLRERLADGSASQGAGLHVHALAADLDVSQTPVREALAHLAGEGLVARLRGGYQTIVYDKAALAELYELAGLLASAAIDDRAEVRQAAQPSRLIELLAGATRNRAVAAALHRVLAQLSPFEPAERAVLGDQDQDGLRAALRSAPEGAATKRLVRGYFRRRARHAGEIIAVFLGLSSGRAARNPRSQI